MLLLNSVVKKENTANVLISLCLLGFSLVGLELMRTTFAKEHYSRFKQVEYLP